VTKSNILTEIYNSSEVAKVIQTLKPVHLQQDILQHCFLELFEKSDEFIIDLYTRNKLKNYIVKILYNTAHFTRTSFAMQYKSKEMPFSDLFLAGQNENFADTMSDFEEDEHLLDWVKKQKIKINNEGSDFNHNDINGSLNKLYWYKREILKLYAKEGTYQKVSDATNIPASSIYLTVLQARREVLKQYHKDQKA